jgi:hypothetical protein
MGGQHFYVELFSPVRKTPLRDIIKPKNILVIATKENSMSIANRSGAFLGYSVHCVGEREKIRRRKLK